MSWTVLLLAAAGPLGAGMLPGPGRGPRPPEICPPGAAGAVGPHRLHYRCDGVGTPAVVLEAGIAASSLSWSRLQPLLARSTRVCSYDRAGLAWSDATSGPRSITALSTSSAEYSSAPGLPPPYVLVGHSFGGLVIRGFSRAHPADVAGLVFVDPLHPDEWCEPSHISGECYAAVSSCRRWERCSRRLGVVRLCLALLSGGAPAAPRQFSRLFGRSAAALLQHMVGEVQKLPAEVLPAVQAHWSNPKAFRGMWQHLAAMPECSADLARGADDFGDTPVVVLSAGARDARWLDADARLARASSRGRHIVSPHSGHWVHLDDPDLVVRAIQDVIKLS